MCDLRIDARSLRDGGAVLLCGVRARGFLARPESGMSKAPKTDVWMPLYVADYARDTFHLTRDQHGGYMLLLMACWSNGGRLPNNPGALAAVTKATPQEWAKLRRVLVPFFQVEGGWLTHKRVSVELEKAARLSATRRSNGALGGRPKKVTETKTEPAEKLPVPKSKANEKLNETPARVMVNIPTSEVPTASQIPSEVKVGSELGDVSTGPTVVPLAGRAGR